jgi:hypothetical protein
MTRWRDVDLRDDARAGTGRKVVGVEIGLHGLRHLELG